MFKKAFVCLMVFCLLLFPIVRADESDVPTDPTEPTETDEQRLPEININPLLTFPNGATIRFYVDQSCRGTHIIGDFDGDYESMKTSYEDGALTSTIEKGGRYFVDCLDQTPPMLTQDDPSYLYIYDVDGIGKISYSDDRTQVNEDSFSILIDGKPATLHTKTKDFITFDLPANVKDGSVGTLTFSDNAGNQFTVSKPIKLIPRTAYSFSIVDSDFNNVAIHVQFNNPNIAHITNAEITTQVSAPKREPQFNTYQCQIDTSNNMIHCPFYMPRKIGSAVENIDSFDITVDYDNAPVPFNEDTISLFSYVPHIIEPTLETATVYLSQDAENIVIKWKGCDAPKFDGNSKNYVGHITQYIVSVESETDMQKTYVQDNDNFNIFLQQPSYVDEQEHILQYKLPDTSIPALYKVSLEVITDSDITSMVDVGSIAISPKTPTKLTASSPYVITGVLLGDDNSLTDLNGPVSFMTPEAFLNYAYYTAVSTQTGPSISYGPREDKPIFTATVSANIPNVPTATAEVLYGETFAWQVSPTVGDWTLSDILVNGISTKQADPIAFENALSTGQLSIDNVYFDMDVKLIYDKPVKNAKISISLSKGGSLSPKVNTATVGSTLHFTVTPSVNYEVGQITVNNTNIGSVRSFDVAVKGDTTISVVFQRTATVLVLKIGNSTMSVNDDTNIKLDSPPIIKNSRTLLPIRAVAEALGARVAWDESTKKVTITSSSIKIEMWIGKNTANVNGKQVPIDSQNPTVKPEIINGRTMLPVRFVAEALGANVIWDNSAQTITITKER